MIFFSQNDEKQKHPTIRALPHTDKNTLHKHKNAHILLRFDIWVCYVKYTFIRLTYYRVSGVIISVVLKLNFDHIRHNHIRRTLSV